ncbi:2OG-Fe(II) oxygenase family protein [Candidatus Pelagibacter sp.]|nr:2OG-Fe(II) oxygenase family protein [Candidatus Pelagibacter sp.]
MTEKLETRIIRTFGPSVMYVKIPKNIVDNINLYIDGIVSDKEKSQNLNAGNYLVGDVTQEFTLESDFIKKSGWYIFLASCVNKWIEFETKKKVTKFEILNSWVVRQFANEYNPTHWHSGHISGAGFLKVPSTFGKHTQNKEDIKYKGGNLQLIHGSRMFLSPSTINIVPSVGDFYFFPNYLMHTVFPFKNTNEERRSISFNAKIDEEIYNVYGN